MPTPQPLHCKIGTKCVIDLVNLYEGGRLNLSPGFQRQSVWKDRDRAKLIDSILRRYPLPAIFLYKREHAGDFVYDVIDGKQRLETIFRFMRVLRPSFSTRFQLRPEADVTDVDWPLLRRKGLKALLTGYELPVIEVDGELSDIIDVFVRINSTGKALTGQEKRHARYCDSLFLKEASRLAQRFEGFFLAHEILSPGQVSRMKHVELVCELMLSLVRGDVLNKKAALDRVMASHDFDGRQLGKAARLTTTTLNRIGRMFPHLRSSRLSQATDFYSLAVLIGKFEQEGLILTDRRRNRLAWDLLKAFGMEVDTMRELQRKAKNIPAGYDLYRDYLLTVSQMTDDVAQRRKREQILRSILESLFARKDAQRGFTAEQRRIIWNEAAQRKCTKCGGKLTWDDFTVDHIDPHSRGGPSRLDNAALMCVSCNSSKGNRRRSRR
jgi:hypothetical protein